MLTNVVTDDPDRVHIGMAVIALFVPVADAGADGGAEAILRFTPAR